MEAQCALRLDVANTAEMLAPEKFADWLSQNAHIDKEYGHLYRYHPRSDAHSKALFKFVMQDLITGCPRMREHATSQHIAYGINLQATWDTSRDKKRLDLAIGTTTEQNRQPSVTSADMPLPEVKERSAILFSCEGKAVITEHTKAKPRLYDELSSSHAIVHRGDLNTIAAGVVVVNNVAQFVSPTNQRSRDELRWNIHKQPHVTEGVIEKLRTLPLSKGIGVEGFDALAIIVVDFDNQGDATLVTSAPAPQPDDLEHYESFLRRVSELYQQQFSVLPKHAKIGAIAKE